MENSYTASCYCRISYLPFFHSCLRVYWLNWVYLLNQNAPQQSGSSSHKNHNVFFFFPLSTWTRKKSSWSNSIRLHSHSHHYNLQKTSYYSSSFICCAGAFGSFWLKWQPASVSRATKRKKIRKKMELKESDSYSMSKPIPWSGQVGVKPSLCYSVLYI